jgi:uncharacterized protein (DUF433 family)
LSCYLIPSPQPELRSGDASRVSCCDHAADESVALAIVARRPTVYTQGVFDRITFDQKVMSGRACIHGMRLSVSVIVSQVAHGATFKEILQGPPDLEREDIQQALEYAPWLTRGEVRAPSRQCCGAGRSLLSAPSGSRQAALSQGSRRATRHGPRPDGCIRSGTLTVMVR